MWNVHIDYSMNWLKHAVLFNLQSKASKEIFTKFIFNGKTIVLMLNRKILNFRLNGKLDTLGFCYIQN